MINRREFLSNGKYLVVLPFIGNVSFAKQEKSKSIEDRLDDKIVMCFLRSFYQKNKRFDLNESPDRIDGIWNDDTAYRRNSMGFCWYLDLENKHNVRELAGSVDFKIKDMKREFGHDFTLQDFIKSVERIHNKYTNKKRLEIFSWEYQAYYY